MNKDKEQKDKDVYLDTNVSDSSIYLLRTDVLSDSDELSDKMEAKKYRKSFDKQ